MAMKVNRADSLRERRARARKLALLVDSDVPARIETRLLLELHGFQVEEVNDCIEAIGLMDLDEPALDLVVLPYEMPLLSGMETLQALRALGPDLKALLFVSGGAAPPEEVLPEGVAFLQKPCTMQSLTEGLDAIQVTVRHH